ncbi:MAG: hypothetical protein HLX50_23445, partial [Alteromonadaceae bacterium]|nr:hypothetical protein [Alteromonadaceae bacterium]
MSPSDTSQPQRYSRVTLIKLLLPSLLGIFIFFVPITLNGHTTIALDHMVTGARSLLDEGSGLYAMAMIIAGGFYPLLSGTWRESLTSGVFTVLKLLGIPVAGMALTGWGPDFLHTPDMLPFLFDKLVIPVGLIVPIGAVFLALLVAFLLPQSLWLYGKLTGFGVTHETKYYYPSAEEVREKLQQLTVKLTRSQEVPLDQLEGEEERLNELISDSSLSYALTDGEGRVLMGAGNLSEHRMDLHRFLRQVETQDEEPGDRPES